MTTPHVNSDDDTDFQQFTGAFDRPIAPAPSFAERLRNEAAKFDRTERSESMESVTTNAFQRDTHRITSVHLFPARSGARWFEIAAAAVLIFALLGGAFFINRIQTDDASPSDDPAGPRLAALSTPGTVVSSGAPTPSSNQFETESVARGGSLQSASDRSLVNPDLTGPVDSLTLKWSHVVSDPHWVMPYGDVVASLGSSELAVQEAATGEILWSKLTSDAFQNSQYDTERDPGLLLGMRSQPMALPWAEGDTLYYVTTTELVGVDLHSGTELMRVNHLVPEGDTGTLPLPWEMSVSDGVAYILSAPVSDYFTVTAIDLESSEQTWQHQIGESLEPDDVSSLRILHLVVARDLMVMQVWGDEVTLLALNVSDGSLAWEVPNPIADPSINTNYNNISAINDEFLVVTQKGYATSSTNSTPNANDALRVALYNMADGSIVWTAREGSGTWNTAGHATGSCRVIPGWDETGLIVPCSDENELQLHRLPFDGGEAELFGSWKSPGQAAAYYYGGETAYFNAGTYLLRIDLTSGEDSSVSLQGGSACAGLPQATSSTFICINDDRLGTYTVQAYGPTAPVSTPRNTP